MRVLVLCRRFPYPLTDGESLRIYHYVTRLSDRHEFDLVCVSGEATSPAAGAFRSVEILRDAIEPRTPNRLRDMFRVDAFSPRFSEVEAHLARVLPERGYDLIWTLAELIRSIPAGAGVPILADICDDAGLFLRRELVRTRDPVEFLRLLKRLVIARQFARRHYAPSQACLFVSEADAGSFRSIAPRARVAVISNGVDSEYFAPAAGPTDPATLVFEGTMDFPPNVDAAVHLCLDLMPRIWARRPDARVVLVGRDPDPRVRALAGDRVTVTGYVDDIRPYVSAATLFVCPLRTGAGIKNKILQAWSMAKAVVATPASVGGLAVADGDNILVRDGSDAFVTAVLSLLDDAATRARLGQRARETILAGYTWDAKALQLERLMRSVAGANRDVPRPPAVEAQPS